MRKIILLFLLIILSGCSVEYNLDIDKGINLKESVSVIANNDIEIDEIINYNGYLPINVNIDDPVVYEEKINGVEYYNLDKVNDNLIKFNYDFNKNEYMESLFVNNAYEFVSVTEVSDELVLSTSKEFLLFDLYNDLEEVKVTVNSKYKLISSNADEENRHSYTWIITPENAYGKNIYLKLDKSQEDLNFFEKLFKGVSFDNIILSLVAIVVGIFIYYVVIIKGKLSNKI